MSRLKYLKEIVLEVESEKITDVSIKHFKSMRNLRRVDLESGSIDLNQTRHQSLQEVKKKCIKKRRIDIHIYILCALCFCIVFLYFFWTFKLYFGFIEVDNTDKKNGSNST